MSVINFDVIDKIVRRRDGFNPVRGERNYTKLHFDFERGYGWDECTVVTASFFASADEIFHEPAIVSNNAAEFNIPTEFSTYRGRLFIGIQGTYQSNGRIVTIATNIVWIDIDKGILIEQGANQNLYEKLIALFSDKYIYATPQMYGAKGDGVTDDTAAIRNAIASSSVVLFPEGVYKITGIEFTGSDDKPLESKTLLALGAKFLFDENSSGNSMFRFAEGSKINIIGGVYEGNNAVQYGLNFVNVQNVRIEGASVKSIGNASLTATAGVSFTGDCSYSKLNNVTVDGVTAGVPGADGYIFAEGIKFSRSSTSGKFSKYVEINNPVINDIGYVNGNNYVTATKGEENNNYYVGNISCKKDILTDYYQKEGDNIIYLSEGKARIDGDGIYLVQSKLGRQHDGIESYIKINNPRITNCSKRAVKLEARCVDIIGGIIDVASWSSAIGIQRARNTNIRNVNIRNTTFTPVTVCGGDGPVIVSGCKITGGGNSANNDGNGGIVLGTKSTGLNTDKEILVIENCEIENTKIPIYSNLTVAAESSVETKLLKISDCVIGFFSGENAIYLANTRFKNIDNLQIENIVFKRGGSAQEVFAANHTHYNTQSGQNEKLYNIEVSPKEALIFNTPSVSGSNLSVFDERKIEANYIEVDNRQYRCDEISVPVDYVSLSDGTYGSDDDFKFSVSDNEITIETVNQEGIPHEVNGNTVDYVIKQIDASLSGGAIPAGEYIIIAKCDVSDQNLQAGLYLSGSLINGIENTGTQVSYNSTYKVAALKLSSSVSGTVKLGVKAGKDISDQTGMKMTYRILKPGTYKLAEMNRTKIISASSTDNEIPTAKAVYDFVQAAVSEMSGS